MIMKAIHKMQGRLFLIFIIILSSLFIYAVNIGERKFSSNQIYRHVKHDEALVLSSDIQIVIIIEESTNQNVYKYALDSMKCYCAIHGYKLNIIFDRTFSKECQQKDKFFRRHCVTAQVLNNAKYTLFLDADMGVVNPKKKIQDYICNDADIIFYDRFYNQEVMAGSYIATNSNWTYNFLMGFANYENKLPKSFHGTDNGALHAYLAEVILPERPYEYYICMEMYKISAGYEDLFAYEACIRAILGALEKFGKIKILEKGTAWARDNWLTNSKWSPDLDFIIHGWKSNQLRDINKEQMPLSIMEKSKSEWFNPIAGDITLQKCKPGNLTWNYDLRLLATKVEIEDKLTFLRRAVDITKFKNLAHIAKRLKL